MNSDLISREALKDFSYINKGNFNTVEGIRKWIDNAPSVELYESVIQKVLNKRCMTAVANEYLIALHGKKPQGKWIPVSERLPAYSGLYLISVDSLVTVANFTGTYFIRRGGLVKVDAWMPLIEPYKKG